MPSSASLTALVRHNSTYDCALEQKPPLRANTILERFKQNCGRSRKPKMPKTLADSVLSVATPAMKPL